MKRCPECGKPMRLVGEKLGKEWQREWRCTDWYSVRSTCSGRESIQKEEQLPIAVIAEDMAREAFSSSQQSKRQGNYRRVAGGVKNINIDTAKYLSEHEAKVLKGAVNILERLATAAEKAKKEKKRFEEEEQRRIDQRRVEAENLAQSLLVSDDMVDAAVRAMALYKINNRHCPWSIGWTKRIRRRSGETLLDGLQREIEFELGESWREMIEYIAWRSDPVPDMLESADEAISKEIVNLRVENKHLIEELKEVLAVESGTNVVRFSS